MSALLTDFYELSMANSYFQLGRSEEIAHFDYFFRRVPDQGGYAIFAGLEQVLNYLENLHFTADEIAFLRRKYDFSPQFLDYLTEFRFTGDVRAVAEGSVVFPNETLLTVRAPLIQCQIIETFLLLSLNHQSRIASKAARLMNAAQGRPVFEFGARRAHGADSANYGARAAYIGGISATSNVYADYQFAVPAFGTMAHAYVQSFPSEYEAFLNYARCYPDGCYLLIDTYDTLRSGIPNAIRVHKEFLAPQGKKLLGVRIDSGDLAYLSKQARQMLDGAGLTDTKISLSNALDEFLIQDLLAQHAAVDSFGVGENLITAKSDPVFGGVYKIVALEQNGQVRPTIKISENSQKTTTPAPKQLWRFYDRQHMAIADLLTLREEQIDPTQPYQLFDPDNPWKRKTISNFTVKPLLQPVMVGGRRTAPRPSLAEIRAHCQAELQSQWKETLRLNNPHKYVVDLSPTLWQLKQDLINRYAADKA